MFSVLDESPKKSYETLESELEKLEKENKKLRQSLSDVKSFLLFCLIMGIGWGFYASSWYSFVHNAGEMLLPLVSISCFYFLLRSIFDEDKDHVQESGNRTTSIVISIVLTTICGALSYFIFYT